MPQRSPYGTVDQEIRRYEGVVSRLKAESPDSHLLPVYEKLVADLKALKAEEQR